MKCQSLLYGRINKKKKKKKKKKKHIVNFSSAEFAMRLFNINSGILSFQINGVVPATRKFVLCYSYKSKGKNVERLPLPQHGRC